MSRADEAMTLTRLSQVRAMSGVLRVRIVNELTLRPLATRSLARRLGMPVTKLYYHLEALRKAGIVQIVSRRRIRNLLEKTYQASARSFRVDPAVFSKSKGRGGAAGAMRRSIATKLDVASEKLRRAIEAGRVQRKHISDVVASEGHARIPISRMAHFQRRAKALLKEFAQLAAKGRKIQAKRGELETVEIGFALLFYPMDDVR